MLAKVAADMQKPDGLTILEGRNLPEKLLTLKLGDFPGIGWKMAKRLEEQGIHDVMSLWALSAKEVKRIWGSIEGERFWYELHGFDVPDRPPPKKSSIGHSHVLAAAMRNAPAARLVARRLLVKAGTRLRRMGYAAGALVLHVSFESAVKADKWAKRSWSADEGWSGDTKFHATQDTAFLLCQVDGLWADLIRKHRSQRFKSVGIVLHALCPADAVMPDLFTFATEDRSAPKRGVQLFNAVDRINKKYGQDTVALGVLPGQIAKYVGAKIAFNRIPDMAEFDE